MLMEYLEVGVCSVVDTTLDRIFKPSRNGSAAIQANEVRVRQVGRGEEGRGGGSEQQQTVVNK